MSSDTNMVFDSSCLYSHGTGMRFNDQIVYYGDNTYGAKVYKAPMNKYLVKVKDHILLFEETLWSDGFLAKTM